MELPVAWEAASDRDHVVTGRRGRDYYRLADQWLRNEVEAFRLVVENPSRAAELLGAAYAARDSLRHWSRT